MVLVRDLNRNGALGRDLRIMSVMGILSRPFLFVLLSELGFSGHSIGALSSPFQYIFYSMQLPESFCVVYTQEH